MYRLVPLVGELLYFRTLLNISLTMYISFHINLSDFSSFGGVALFPLPTVELCARREIPQLITGCPEIEHVLRHMDLGWCQYVFIYNRKCYYWDLCHYFVRFALTQVYKVQKGKLFSFRLGFTQKISLKLKKKVRKGDTKLKHIQDYSICYHTYELGNSVNICRFYMK